MNATQFSNLLFLRDTVIPWMERNPERVNLDELYADAACGTVACLAGWYGIMKYGKWDSGIQDRVCADFGCGIRLNTGFLAIPPDHCLFGTETFFGHRTVIDTLADRKARLNEIIAEHEHLFADVTPATLPFRALMDSLNSPVSNPGEVAV